MAQLAVPYASTLYYLSSCHRLVEYSLSFQYEMTTQTLFI